MMVISLLLVLNFSIGASAGTNYDRQEVDACITVSQRVFVKGGSGATLDINTGIGYDASDPPVRSDGEWSINDMKQALLGHSPRGLGNPDIHHGGQMPGGSLHEVLPKQHRNNSAVHLNVYNQGGTNKMRNADRQFHWWHRAQEQGADQLLPDWIYVDYKE